ncbi:alpha/beta hydrolase [Paenibacillus athensensis]|uniref:Carboxylesterase n=1 Tax=Paenibacillus athensensis TaxID=1967502 RepID=A0A4Y8Q8G1_9BACL|nr:alpha/beta hydrolase [Paenibacillus athensensis]MCD1260362.1 alpha/beta hydrolase [Paenibacillus athensensis]
MIHLYEPATQADLPTLVLLHGTGANERDLLPLAAHIAPGAGLLALRGNVSENGMLRFFRRIAEGVFDEEDLVFRTRELYAFLDEAADRYGLNRRRFVALGYSNGANIAASLLLHYSDAFQGAMLHHPMVPIRGVGPADISGLPVFIGAGRNDPICKPQETEELTGMLRQGGAEVEVHWEYAGHHLTASEADAAAAWFGKQFA